MTANQNPPPSDLPLPRTALAVMCLFPFFFGMLALALGPDANWDLRNYHWYNAYALLTGRTARGIDLMPSQGQFFFNPLADVPLYWLGTHLPPRAAAFIWAALQGLNFPLLFLLSWRCLAIADAARKTAACTALAVLGMLSGMGISEIGTAFQDNTTSLGILLSALLVTQRIDRLNNILLTRALWCMFACAIPAGMAAGLKLTCISSCIGLFVGLFAAAGARRGVLALAFGFGMLAGFILTYGAWAAHLYNQTGSPFFPLYNVIFRSPLLPLRMYIDYAPPANRRFFIFPFLFALDPHLVNEITWRDFRVPVLYALVLILAAVTVARKIAGKPALTDRMTALLPGRFLLVSAGVTYLVWMLTETVYRYLLPVDMMAPLLVVLCVAALPFSRRTGAAIAAMILLAIALTIRPGTWGRLPAWPAEPVSITDPGLPDDPDVMVLMAGTDAYGYLVTAFPPRIPLVRIQSRGFPPDAKTGLHDLIRRRIDAHRGRLYLFMPTRQLDIGRAALGHYGLAAADDCRTVTDNHARAGYANGNGNGEFPAEYSLCEVKRSEKGN